MNLQEYIKSLEAKNGYCSCEDLTSLFEARKKAESLEKICDYLKAGVDLENPKPEDKGKLDVYLKAAENLGEKIDNYHRELFNNINIGKLRLFLHDEEQFRRIYRISPEKAKRLLKEEKIITVHCSVCDQQVDRLS